MFFIVRSNDSFNFPLGWIKYIVIVITAELTTNSLPSQSKQKNPLSIPLNQTWRHFFSQNHRPARWAVSAVMGDVLPRWCCPEHQRAPWYHQSCAACTRWRADRSRTWCAGTGAPAPTSGPGLSCDPAVNSVTQLGTFCLYGEDIIMTPTAQEKEEFYNQ